MLKQNIKSSVLYPPGYLIHIDKYFPMVSLYDALASDLNVSLKFYVDCT